MNTQPDDPKSNVVDRIADTVKQRTQSSFGIDWRLPVATIVTALIGLGCYVFLLGGMRQSFADVQMMTQTHETRIRGLEIDLGQTNNEVATVRGKIEGLDGKLDAILSLLQTSAYHPPHRPAVP